MPYASQSVMLGSVRCWFANNSDVLTCLIKVVTAIKLRKVMGFLPFVMNNYSWGDPLGKNPVSHPTFHPRVFFFLAERGLLPSCGAQVAEHRLWVLGLQ